MQRKKDTLPFERKSKYNPNRSSYLTADGKYYCYEYWDSDADRIVTQQLEVGKDLSVELTVILDEADHDADLTERYETELRDPLFDTKVATYEKSRKTEDSVSPWDTLPAASDDSDDEADADEADPMIEQVRRIIEENCTEAQQKFFYEHFGMGMQLEEMRQAEAQQTGKLPTAAAMTNRKNKIIDKVAKALGVERVKRHSYPKKG